MKNFTILILLAFISLSSFVFAQIPTTGLVAWYPFTGNVIDSSGSGFNGINNGATLVTDRFGNANKAYYFNGINAFINLPNFSTLTNYSISVWVKDDITNDCGRIFSNACFGSCYTGSIDLFTDGYYNTSNLVEIVNQSGTNQSLYYPSSASAVGTAWSHIVVTFDNINLIQKIYINDIEWSGTYSTGWSTTPLTPNQSPIFNYRIGCNGGGTAYKYFQGSIDDIRVYNRALNNQEIQALYHEGGWSSTIVTQDNSTYIKAGYTSMTNNNPSGGRWIFGQNIQVGDTIVQTLGGGIINDYDIPWCTSYECCNSTSYNGMSISRHTIVTGSKYRIHITGGLNGGSYFTNGFIIFSNCLNIDSVSGYLGDAGAYYNINNNILTFHAGLDYNGCSCSNCGRSDFDIYVTSLLPSKPTTPSGTTTLCNNTANTNYITSATNATAYTWGISPLTAGTISGTGITGTIDWNNSFSGSAKIFVKGINSGLCEGSVSDTLFVTVNPLPLTATIPTGETTLCLNPANSVYTTSAANASSFNWYISPSGAGTITGTGTTATVDWDNAFIGSATITAQGVNTCGTGSVSNSISINIYQYPLQSATPIGTNTLCQDAVNTDYTTTGATNAATYHWSIYPSNAGTISGTGITGTVNWDAYFSGTAHIKVKGINVVCDGAYSDSIPITVLSAPVSAITPATATTFCQGNSVILNATTGSNYFYQWQKNGANISATNASYTATQTGSYTVIITNISGCSATSAPVTITVNPLPTATISPVGPINLCQGNMQTLSANTGTGLTYQWQKDDANITGAVGVNCIANQQGDYAVIVTNSYTCSTTSTPVTVTVNQPPTATITAQSNTTFCYGGSVVLSADSSIGLTFQWQKNGVDIANATNQTYSATQSGNYSVVITNAANCTATDIITITVNSLPSANAGNDTSICQGNAVTLNATGGTTYVWNNSVSQNVSFTPTTTKTYTVTVTDANNCSKTDSVIVTVNPLPIVEAGNVQTVCANTVVTLTATVTSGTSPFTYHWSNGILQATPFSISATTTFTVSVTDINNCVSATDNITVNVNALPNAEAGNPQSVCAGNTVTLNATGGSIYTWSNGVINGIPFIPTQTKYYTVNVSDAIGCTAKDSVLITVWSLPNANAGNDQSVCSGDTITLIATGGTSYVWNHGILQNTPFVPTTTTTYTVTVTDVNTCIKTDSVTLTLMPSPSVPTITYGGGYLQSSAISGNQWYNNNVIIPGATGQTYHPTITGSYYVVVTDGNGCSAQSLPYSFTSGIEENTDNNIFSIYPNPVKNELTIELVNSNKKLKFELQNEIGQTIYTSTVDKKIAVDISKMSVGIYFIKLYTEKTVLIKKFIKE